MTKPNPAEPQNETSARWSYRRVPAARELLDLVAAELAREFVQLLENGSDEKSTITSPAHPRERK